MEDAGAAAIHTVSIGMKPIRLDLAAVIADPMPGIAICKDNPVFGYFDLFHFYTSSFVIWAHTLFDK
jgi:hypothetical protein